MDIVRYLFGDRDVRFCQPVLPYNQVPCLYHTLRSLYSQYLQSLPNWIQLPTSKVHLVGSTEAPSKVFLLFFLLPDWLNLNHLKSRMECGFSDIFSRHICSNVEETIGVINNPASFGAKKCSETTFEVAEMILGPWNQQTYVYFISLKGPPKLCIKYQLVPL